MVVCVRTPPPRALLAGFFYGHLTPCNRTTADLQTAAAGQCCCVQQLSDRDSRWSTTSQIMSADIAGASIFWAFCLCGGVFFCKVAGLKFWSLRAIFPKMQYVILFSSALIRHDSVWWKDRVTRFRLASVHFLFRGSPSQSSINDFYNYYNMYKYHTVINTSCSSLSSETDVWCFGTEIPADSINFYLKKPADSFCIWILDLQFKLRFDRWLGFLSTSTNKVALAA